MMNGYSANGMGVWGLWGLVLVGVVIAVAALAAVGGVWWGRRLRGGFAATAPAVEDEARERLRQRYAAGEIDDEEYERRLAALTWR